MKTYTTIEFFTQDEEEVYGTIMHGQRAVGNCMIVGKWEGEEDILKSLEEEASRLNYKKIKKNNMKKETFTREEVLELIIEAFKDGMATGGDDYDEEFFVADDYLLKFDKENETRD